MQKAQYVFPIIGGRKVEHLHDNIKALSIHLTDAQIEALESVRPFDIGFPMNFVGVDPHITGQSGPLVNAVAKVDWQSDGKPIGHE
jgi:diketogulonate reductase-like aldo/keto reductase